MSKDRPHRRLSLTSPTPPAEPIRNDFGTAAGEFPQLEPAPAASQVGKLEPAPTTPAKLMVYFEPAEADLLDNLWFKAKKARPRLSKSDVMRAALLLLNDYPEQLDSVLARLHTSTESRQRASRKG